jgi:hypothetical protein
VILSPSARMLIELLAIEMGDEFLREDSKPANVQAVSSWERKLVYVDPNGHLNAKESRE